MPFGVSRWPSLPDIRRGTFCRRGFDGRAVPPAAWTTTAIADLGHGYDSLNDGDRLIFTAVEDGRYRYQLEHPPASGSGWYVFITGANVPGSFDDATATVRLEMHLGNSPTMPEFRAVKHLVYPYGIQIFTFITSDFTDPVGAAWITSISLTPAPYNLDDA